MKVKTQNWKGENIEIPLDRYIENSIAKHGPNGELEQLKHEVSRLSEIVALLLAERVKTNLDLKQFGIYLEYGEELIHE